MWIDMLYEISISVKKKKLLGQTSLPNNFINAQLKLCKIISLSPMNDISSKISNDM